MGKTFETGDVVHFKVGRGSFKGEVVEVYAEGAKLNVKRDEDGRQFVRGPKTVRRAAARMSA